MHIPTGLTGLTRIFLFIYFYVVFRNESLLEETGVHLFKKVEGEAF